VPDADRQTDEVSDLRQELANRRSLSPTPRIGEHRHRHRLKHTDTHTDIDRDRDRDRDRQTHTDTQTDRHTDRLTDMDADTLKTAREREAPIPVLITFRCVRLMRPLGLWPRSLGLRPRYLCVHAIMGVA